MLRALHYESSAHAVAKRRLESGAMPVKTEPARASSYELKTTMTEVLTENLLRTHDEASAGAASSSRRARSLLAQALAAPASWVGLHPLHPRTR